MFMCNASECLQITLKRPTPCFTALGSVVCDLETCSVAQYLATRRIDLESKNRLDLRVIDYALHNVCPQSIHNPDLTKAQQAQVIAGLIASLNK